MKEEWESSGNNRNEGVNFILHRTKHFLIVSILFILAACGLGDEKKDSEDTTSKSEENRIEISSEQTAEEEEVTEQINENTNESTVKEPTAVKEESEFQWIYDELNGKSFIFSSGAGAWRTVFTFKENGQFTGTYSDANGPDVYVSEFAGEFDIKDEVDEFTYLLDLNELQVVSDTGKEEVDGEMTITYVDEPHGFQSGSQEFELYLPYKPKNQVSEEYLSWVYGQANNDYDFLNSFGLYNKAHGFGMEELFD